MDTVNIIDRETFIQLQRKVGIIGFLLSLYRSTRIKGKTIRLVLLQNTDGIERVVLESDRSFVAISESIGDNYLRLPRDDFFRLSDGEYNLCFTTNLHQKFSRVKVIISRD